jgi:hypothetical protein
MIRPMPQPLEIRALSLAEMPLVLGRAQHEGWNPGLSDATPFWLTDPKGFIGGFIDDRLVACSSAVRYGDQFGFMGFYIVDAPYRGNGYGIQMWQSALDHLQGVSSIGLDGVVAQQDNYRKSGFLIAHRNMRFEGRLPFPKTRLILRPEERLVPILEVPTDVITNFDALHFPISRPTFLEGWLRQPEHHGLAIMRGHQICAYGIVRPCATGYKIGPLFADNLNQARSLVLALCQDLKDEAPIYLDPPAANTAAVDLAKELGMTMVFETARMYRGLTPKLPIEKIFGITTFELG